MSECIYVCPLGSVEKEILDCVTESLSKKTKVAVRVLPAMGDPAYAYDKKRGQYNSKRVLKRLSASCPRQTFKIIGVTWVDLYVPILTFVFGAAQMSGQCGVISTRRLDPRFYQAPEDRNLLLERVRKTAVHELGHSMGLIHCRDRRCVMFSSTRIEDTDFKEEDFCHTCRELFKWNLDRCSGPCEMNL
ncbi:MAG: archaemetzincin family Zn-dependent metalloprotease [Deltaproteobacteria bacterium]|nr:archaemetzincin family Zn-dependent metalloprotease [Deltaproteobacteria bacterium]